MLAPVCAWVAIRGEIVIQNPWDLLPALVTGGAVLFWVAGFDIIYACQDYQFDRDARLRSIPVRLGVANALRLAAGLHVLMVALLALLPLVDRWGGPHLGLGNLYGIGTAAIAGLLCYEHWIVRPNDLSRVNQAFFNVNVIVSVGLLLVATVDAVW
jgi:4-hydroxybenzoate polyprenyltransferase